MDRDDHLSGWQALHGGYQPDRITAAWLRLVHRLAAPLAARRAPPDALTLGALLPAAAVVVTAHAGGRWPLAGTLLLVVSGVLDGLDGAVAVMTGRTTGYGQVLDSVVDRLVDGMALVALWLLGAEPGLVVGAGGALVLLEYVRARAAAAGMRDIGLVTVGERPTRLIVVVATLLTAGVLPGRAGTAATAGAAATLAVCVIGMAQLWPVVRRRLR